MFDHIGVAPRLQELVEHCPGNRYHFKGLDLAEHQVPATDFRQLENTRFNYYGKINQNDLEQALRNHLASNYGHSPEWNVECTSIQEHGSEITANLLCRADGEREEAAPASWLVGADGVRSMVRAHLGGSFDNPDSFMGSMSMADVRLHGYEGDASWVNYYTSDTGFLLLTHLPGDKYRVYLTGEMEKKLEEMDMESAYQWALDYFETGATLDGVLWSSTWPIHRIVGEVYVRDHIVLCGDATHVHSPAGGQGMNACLQDGFNLGWKLANVINGSMPESILSSYKRERQPIAEQVTEGANFIHDIIINTELSLEHRYKLTEDPDWHDTSINRISGLSHTYRGNVFIPEGVSLLKMPVQPGDRAPDATLQPGSPQRRIHDLTRHPGFSALLVPTRAQEIGRCAELADELKSSYGAHVESFLITKEPSEEFDYDHAFADLTGEFDKFYGTCDAGRIVLIRPDLVVGYQSTLAEGDHVLAYLDSWFERTPL
jgi:NADPH-dependent dioxygenase